MSSPLLKRIETLEQQSSAVTHPPLTILPNYQLEVHAYGETNRYVNTEVSLKFHADKNPVRLLIGPVGCGKSVACCNEIMLKAHEQERGNDGIRRSRWAIVRNTYPQLKITTIKTWRDWFPPSVFGKLKMDSPPTQLIKMGDIELEILFIALDNPDDVAKLKSLELTGVYINELQYIHYEIFMICSERVNRYPPKKYGAAITWTGIIADTNPPDTDHWIYDYFEEKLIAGYSIYHYAPAIIKCDEAEAEATSLNGTCYKDNPTIDYGFVQNDRKYWIKMVPSRNDEEINVSLCGNYGTVTTGKPVHANYNDQLHRAPKPLLYNKEWELGLGWDFGHTPACIVVQFTPTAQLRVVHEFWSEAMDLLTFARDNVIPTLDKLFVGWRDNYISRHDPAGNTGSDGDGKSCALILRDLGIISSSPPSNDPTRRRYGLNYFLTKMSGGYPAFQLSPQAVRTRKGLMGGFKYERVRAANQDVRYHDKPVKNMYSHPCEALEYIAMYYAPQAISDEKQKDNENKTRSRMHRGDWRAR